MLKTLLAVIVFLSCFAIAGETQQNEPPSQGPKQTDPCANAMTQHEMNQCAGVRYTKADERLNRMYAKLMASFHDEEKKQTLRTIEKAWLHYRDLHCEAARKEYEGGSIVPLIYANCMTMVTKHRIEEIKAAYENPELSLE
jgi:uncharacterized protein YecT (DUF1311 family)